LGNWRKVVALLALMMLGVSPYLYLVIRSQMDPLISFYGPIATWDEFVYGVTRGGVSDSE